MIMMINKMWNKKGSLWVVVNSRFFDCHINKIGTANKSYLCNCVASCTSSTDKLFYRPLNNKLCHRGRNSWGLQNLFDLRLDLFSSL